MNQPPYMYSPERLQYMREYNRAYRKMLRGGKPPMPFRQRGIVGSAVAVANRRRRAEEKKLKAQTAEGL